MILTIKIKQKVSENVTMDEVVKIADKVSKAVDGDAEIKWDIRK